jgi:hypothetical protein
MRIPGSERAVVEIRKLRDYVLNPFHLRGRHKARVFEASLGYTGEHSVALQQEILEAVHARDDARLVTTDDFGERYVLEFEVEGPKGKVEIRTIWIVRRDEDFPRLVTCYLL